MRPETAPKYNAATPVPRTMTYRQLCELRELCVLGSGYETESKRKKVPGIIYKKNGCIQNTDGTYGKFTSTLFNIYQLTNGITVFRIRLDPHSIWVLDPHSESEFGSQIQMFHKLV
jgi:hypothetical protein